jgi:DNA-directed RNA polymerase specialized sigma24 family protein
MQMTFASAATRVVDVADLGQSAHDRAEAHELLESVGRVLSDELTARQRTVLTEVAINGTSTAALAELFDTTPGRHLQVSTTRDSR